MRRSMMTTTLVGAVWAGWSGVGAAQPVGLGACDNFLAAYAQCAASPSVPADSRMAIQQGIEALRSSFRSAVAQDPAARETVRQQCVSSHELVRSRLMEALKCDFPAASTMTVAADSVAPAAPATAKPAAKASDPAAEVAKKANAYTKLQNEMVERRPMARQLSEHITNNERVLKLGTKLGANAFYLFGIDDFDPQIADLKEAMALPGALPEVDPAAASLLSALEAVNPVIKELYRYQKMREFKEDGFKLAKEREKPLEDGMRGAIRANTAFSTALFDRRMAIDEARLAKMETGSLAQGLLATSLKTRLLIRQYDAMEKPADVPAFMTALDAMRESNKALIATTTGLSPKANSYCAEYSEALDSLVGSGRDLAGDMKAKRGIGDTSAAFARNYNSSVDYYGKCLKDEARARG